VFAKSSRLEWAHKAIDIEGRSPGTTDSDAIVDFHLDSIKTHCFVSFNSITAASRVRGTCEAGQVFAKSSRLEWAHKAIDIEGRSCRVQRHR
jgi:hypothetical protein